MLPIYLSGCKELLVAAGPTYCERLWCDTARLLPTHPPREARPTADLRPPKGA